jgi:predicted nucleic acid-binding protein
MPAVDFLDTNIVIYAYSLDATKKQIATDLLSDSPTISTQVLNESISVFRRKQLIPDGQIHKAVDKLSLLCRVQQISVDTIRQAIDLINRHQFSYYDALMIASAMEAGCTTLYSEDMQHGQIVGALKLVNPFYAAPVSG